MANVPPSVQYFLIKTLFEYELFRFLEFAVYSRRYMFGKLEESGPVIMCGTHFNCFMDSVTLITMVPRQVSTVVSESVSTI